MKGLAALCRPSTAMILQEQGTSENACSMMLKLALHYAAVAKLVDDPDLCQMRMLLSDTRLTLWLLQ